jgi:pimeloyl-ACP methyl ester carboxylesterase
MTSATEHTALTAPTQFVEVGDIRFAYRRFGTPNKTPIVLTQHFMGNLDNYDPAISDALAWDREVVLTDNAGVGLSTGPAADTIAGMAGDIASLIDALDLPEVDVFGLSMGGHVAQQIALDRPELVRRLILVGTGPRGGEGMQGLPEDVAALFTRQYMPQDLMWLPVFFSPSEDSQAAGQRWLERVRARTEERDLAVVSETIAAHLAAAGEWGTLADDSYDYLKNIHQPALVVNGSNDIIVPTINSYILQQHMPNAELVLYPDSNHGAHFQYTDRFVDRVLTFLEN